MPRSRMLWRTLAPVVAVLLVTAACQQSSPSQVYTGVQARTPIEKIGQNGDMKNFELVGWNPLKSDKFDLPRGMNGGITAAGNCVYVGSSIAQEPAVVLDVSDVTKPVVVGSVPGIPGKGMGIEAIEAVPDLGRGQAEDAGERDDAFGLEERPRLGG